MAGIYPNLINGGVDSSVGTHTYTPTIPNPTPPLYFPNNCKMQLTPEVMNSILSEFTCLVDKSGFAWNPTDNCNLYNAVFWMIHQVLAGWSATCGTTAPTAPAVADYWMDTTTTPAVLKKYTAQGWVTYVPIAPYVNPKFMVCKNCNQATVYFWCGTGYFPLTNTVQASVTPTNTPIAGTTPAYNNTNTYSGGNTSGGTTQIQATFNSATGDYSYTDPTTGQVVSGLPSGGLYSSDTLGTTTLDTTTNTSVQTSDNSSSSSD